MKPKFSLLAVLMLTVTLALVGVLRDVSTSKALIPNPVQPFLADADGGLASTKLSNPALPVVVNNYTITNIPRGSRTTLPWIYSGPGWGLDIDKNMTNGTDLGSVFSYVDAQCDSTGLGVDDILQQTPCNTLVPPRALRWQESTTAVEGTGSEFLKSLVPPYSWLARHTAVITNLCLNGASSIATTSILNTVYTNVPFAPNGSAYTATTKLGGDPVIPINNTCLDSPQSSTSITNIYHAPYLEGDSDGPCNAADPGTQCADATINGVWTDNTVRLAAGGTTNKLVKSFNVNSGPEPGNFSAHWEIELTNPNIMDAGWDNTSYTKTADAAVALGNGSSTADNRSLYFQCTAGKSGEGLVVIKKILWPVVRPLPVTKDTYADDNAFVFVVRVVCAGVEGSPLVDKEVIWIKPVNPSQDHLQLELGHPAAVVIDELKANHYSGAETGTQCTNASDDDGDGKINDGCPAVKIAETGGQCNDAADAGEDSPADGVVNDGCPAVAAAVNGQEWLDAEVSDVDGVGGPDLIVAWNPASVTIDQGPPAETLAQCNNAIDDDDDDVVNDGCPAVGTGETGAECSNSIDENSLDTLTVGYEDDDGDATHNETVQDGDGGKVNDGCPAMPLNFAPTPVLGAEECVLGDFTCITYSVSEPQGQSDVQAQLNILCPMTTVPGLYSVVVKGIDAPLDITANVAAETACDDAIDNDSDGYVNDGCTAVDIAETGRQCRDAADAGEDSPADAKINDGCPARGTPVGESKPSDNAQRTVIKVWCGVGDGAGEDDGIEDANGLYARWTVFQSVGTSSLQLAGELRLSYKGSPSIPSDTGYVERLVDLQCYWLDDDGCDNCDSQTVGEPGYGYIDEVESWQDPDLLAYADTHLPVRHGIDAVDTDGDCVMDAAFAQPSHPVDSLDEPLTDASKDCAQVPYSEEPNVVIYNKAADRDCDGLVDGIERAWGSNPLADDSDSDGAKDFVEIFQQTNPLNPDTDGDTYKDAPVPTYTNTNTAYDNCPGIANADQANNDGQRFDNGNIAGTWASNPNQDKMGDACDADDDNDWLPDAYEITTAKSNPMVMDSDGDTVGDGAEVIFKKSPTDNTKYPEWKTTDTAQQLYFRGCHHNLPAAGTYGSSTIWDYEYDAPHPHLLGSNDVEMDVDGDGILCGAGGDPDSDNGTGTDSPGPVGFPDSTEAFRYALGIANNDTDGDGCPDWVEITDLDGNREANINDVFEVAPRAFPGGPVTTLEGRLCDLDANLDVNINDVYVAAQNSAFVRPADATCTGGG